MIRLMMPFRTFSFLDFVADLLQKSISVASNLFACCVFSVHVSAPNSKILWTEAKPKYLKILVDCHSHVIEFNAIIRNYYNIKGALKFINIY
jgi:hypothetical protein